MYQQPRDTQLIQWLVAENMLLAVCLKAALSKLDPEVSREVGTTLNAVLDAGDGPGKDLLTVVAADLVGRIMPDR